MPIIMSFTYQYRYFSIFLFEERCGPVIFIFIFLKHFQQKELYIYILEHQNLKTDWRYSMHRCGYSASYTCTLYILVFLLFRPWVGNERKQIKRNKKERKEKEILFYFSVFCIYMNCYNLYLMFQRKIFYNLIFYLK